MENNDENKIIEWLKENKKKITFAVIVIIASPFIYYVLTWLFWWIVIDVIGFAQ